MAIVALTAATTHGATAVQVGQTVSVDLDDISTTGYRWAPDPVDAAVLVPSGESGSAGSAPGASGRRQFVFRAVGPGRVTLGFELRRPWETGVAPIEIRTLDVEVRP